MTSSSYPQTVKQPVQLNTSHTSPLDPSGSSRPNNSNHQKPPLSLQKSSAESFLRSSKITSSSSSSSQKPIPVSSPKRLSTGTTQGLKAGLVGKSNLFRPRNPLFQVIIWPYMVRHRHLIQEWQGGALTWEIQKLLTSQGFQMNDLIISGK